ncbi:MAG: hypothetical protein GF334_07975 [Candidatus Altiarchaeales archaeon]|nr:hypothetical protein [Candidatus Altiarchaeales archaeon]
MGDVFDINDHPGFKPPPEDLSGEDLNWEVPLLPEKEEEPPPLPKGPTETGRRYCSLCRYRQDERPWWRRLLARAKPSDYLCLRFERTPVIHPVTQEITYFRNSLPIPGAPLFTEEKYRRCEEINQDGKCSEYAPPEK